MGVDKILVAKWDIAEGTEINIGRAYTFEHDSDNEITQKQARLLFCAQKIATAQNMGLVDELYGEVQDIFDYLRDEHIKIGKHMVIDMLSDYFDTTDG